MKTSANRRSLNRVVLIAAALLALLAGYWLGNLNTRSALQDISATILPEPRPIGNFSLVDGDGQPFGPAQLSGHWSFLFFGYASCPDICPAALHTLSRVYNRLAEDPELQQSTRIVFVSVDPERDTPEILRDYVRYFNPEFVGATGSEADIESFTQRFSAVYMKHAPEDGSGNYLVDHSAFIYLVDPDGGFYGLFSGAEDPTIIANDFLKIAKNRR